MKKGPFKMKGYSYPGTSPMKLEPVITAALITAGAAALGAGTTAVQGSKNRKAQEKLQKEEEIALANQKAQEGLTKDISMKSPSIAQ